MTRRCLPLNVEPDGLNAAVEAGHIAEDTARIIGDFRDFLRLPEPQKRARAAELARLASEQTGQAPCQGECAGCGAGEDQPCVEGCACVAAGVHDRDGFVEADRG